MGIAKRVLAMSKTDPNRNRYIFEFGLLPEKSYKPKNNNSMTNNLSVKKGDQIELNDGRRGTIVKYSSNKEITLNTGIVIDKTMIKGLVKEDGLVAIPIPVAVVIKPIAEPSITEVTRKQDKVIFSHTSETIEEIYVKDTFAIYTKKDKRTSYQFQIFQQVEILENGQKKKGTGTQNWIRFVKVYDRLRNGEFATSQEFLRAIRFAEVEIFELREKTLAHA
jgi:preprotein translocase subunit YajC